MRREDLAHVLHAASRIVPDAEMLIIGSQAIHGGIRDTELPELTMLPFPDEAAEGAHAKFLEPHDLALSKLAAQRSKDLDFVSALIDADLLSVDVLLSRLATLPVAPVVRKNIAVFLRGRRSPSPPRDS